MTVYAMADKYSSASKWQTTKARMEYRGRIVHTAGKRNEVNNFTLFFKA